jgi:hypothetical protein
VFVATQSAVVFFIYSIIRRILMNKKLLLSSLLLSGLLFAQASHAILIGLLKADNTPLQGEIIGNQLFLVNGDGKKTLAPNGTYRKKEGGAIIIEGHVIKSGGRTSLGPKPDDPSANTSLGPKPDDPSANKASNRFGGAGNVMLNPQPLPPGGGGDKSKPGVSPGGLPASGVGTTSLGPKQDDPTPPQPSDKTSNRLGGAGNVMLNPQPLPPGGGDKNKSVVSPGGLPAKGTGMTSIGPKQDDPAPPPPANKNNLVK